MKRRSLVVGIFIAIIATTTAFGQSQKAPDNLQVELERLHNQWFTAFDKGDGATMDGIEVPNLILVNADGKGGVWQKPGPRAGNQKPTGATHALSNVRVRQFGDTAVLTGVLLAKSGTESGSSSTTVVFVKRNNQWMIASAQWSDIPASTKK